MDYTAHIRDGDAKEQTVREHCMAVAELSAKFGKKIGVESLASLQGVIHDSGKLSKDFDDYIHGATDYSRGEIDHSFAGGKYIFESAEESGKAEFRSLAAIVARTIVSHHGLHDWIDEDGNDYLSKRISKDDRYNEIKCNISEVIAKHDLTALMEKAASEYGAVSDIIRQISGGKAEKVMFYFGMFERLMQSILIDADRTDTADFMSGYPSGFDIDSQAVWRSMGDKLEEKYREFSKRTDVISLRRTDISDRCAAFANHKVGVCRLVVPTGGGKTLSSLRFAVNYCKKFDMDKIFYIAPFMSILEQNSDVIRELAGDEAFLEHYSDMLQKLDDAEELSEYELRCVKWDSPVIATTLVQFLNTLFSGKSSSVRRMHCLCSSVIIIDEVQSVPVKCVHLFNLAINFLTKICGCTVVLCSATQPTLEKTEYPIIIDSQSSMTGDYSDDFTIFKRVNLIDMVEPEGFSYDYAADFCYQRYRENKSLLIVLNTKTSAAEMFNRIAAINDKEEDGGRATVIHLSTNMCPEHRRNCINETKRLLKSGQNIICVTTQLIEAGVDISFKCVVRSLAGMDNAAQAAGRCNRNGEYECCPVYIIRLSEESLAKLKEIKNAQSVSTQLLKMGGFDDNLSAGALSAYFEKFYSEMKDQLSYQTKDLEDTTILDMLSLNSQRFQIKRTAMFPHAQAFASAGKKFQVIEEKTVDVLVPYNDEAKRIIIDLNSAGNPNDLSDILRKAQKYIVGLYENTKRKLEEKGALYTVGNDSILVLKEGFYDENFGVNTDGEEDFECCV